MKSLTKTQRIYVAVLVVVVSAFAVDKVFLSGDGSVQQAGADGGPTPGQFAPPPAAPLAPMPLPAGTIQEKATLAEVLRSCDTLAIESVREAFQPSESWLLVLTPPPPPPPTPSPESDPEEPEPISEIKTAALLKAQAFADTHRLVSVIRTNDGGTALVGEKVVSFGQALDGFKLVRLTEQSAFFEADGMRVELRLPKNGQSH